MSTAELEAAQARLDAKREDLAPKIEAALSRLPNARRRDFDPKPNFEKLEVLPDEPAACPCRGRGWVVEIESNLARPCKCAKKTWPSPEAVPVSELEARGCRDPKVNRALKIHWEGKEPWPPELDLWPGMELESGIGRPGERPRWLYIWGPPGSGKSAGAAWIMRRAITRGCACHWIPLRDAVRDYYDAMGREEPSPVWAHLSRPFVVLEDLGTHREDLPSHEDPIQMFVEERHTSPDGFQVVTSNWSPDELRQIPGHERIASRVLSGHDLPMLGPDARQRRWKFKDALAETIRRARQT